ncbi:MAG TPA: proteasome subunit beta [Acidimicrobiales bacterium]|nr:proteasome subunit beta [Acidimicrobiales bacterium]
MIEQGTDFVALLRASGHEPFPTAGAAGPTPPIPHATTICAIRYADGVVMAGDRRATAGNIIAHRAMEKIYPADRHSGVAIAGAAGAAMEMVKLFQLQLEHYEKLEGIALSFEGKANTLAQMVRSNLTAALQLGMVVVPLFAGYDLRRKKGRIFTYDVTGGRYEETDYQAEGSGGRDARTTIKLGWREDLPRAEAIELAIQALWEAADEDSATGGPDPIRGIYPMMATITEAGFEELPDAEIAERFDAFIERKRRQSNGNQPQPVAATRSRARSRSTEGGEPS